MSIVFAILLFSLLIFVHELGHFVAAKLSGVQVNEFSMFMGPAIFKKQVGETLYSIRTIPIGGFCAMEGEDEETENPRSFRAAAWWKRLIILVAGSFMNFVAGFLIMLLVFSPVEAYTIPVISDFDEFSTVNGAEGLQVGDTILELDGEKIYVYPDFSMLLSMNPGQTHDLLVLRDGKKVLLDDLPMELHDTVDEDGNPTQRYGIHFTLREADFSGKLSYAWNSTLNTVRTVRLSLQMLVNGRAGFSDLGGPVQIVKIMSDSAEQSKDATDALYNMLYLGGFIAINLAVMNMLPLPALDGGRVFGLVVTTCIEAITKKKIDPKYEGYIHGAGMIILLVFMAVIMFKDIFTIIRG